MEELGVGGFGYVTKVKNRSTRGLFALKTIPFYTIKEANGILNEI